MDIFTNNVFIFYVILLLFACFFLYVLCIFVFYVKSCPYSHPAIYPPQPKIRAALSDSYFLPLININYYIFSIFLTMFLQILLRLLLRYLLYLLSTGFQGFLPDTVFLHAHTIFLPNNP